MGMLGRRTLGNKLQFHNGTQASGAVAKSSGSLYTVINCISMNLQPLNAVITLHNKLKFLERGRDESVLFLKYFQRWIECRFPFFASTSGFW